MIGGPLVPMDLPDSAESAKCKPTSLNEVFCICWYQPGGFFQLHLNGEFQLSKSEQSLHTFMIYLNDDFEGGATQCYTDLQLHYQEGDPSQLVYSYQSRAGDALVFYSHLTHDGQPGKRDQKYMMYSKVMYIRDEAWKRSKCKPDFGELANFEPVEAVFVGEDIESDEDD
jgi:hypothetical protein